MQLADLKPSISEMPRPDAIALVSRIRDARRAGAEKFYAKKAEKVAKALNPKKSSRVSKVTNPTKPSIDSLLDSLTPDQLQMVLENFD